MLPNFLIIGAPRSGTTTLYETLKQHPQIYLSPVKEPMFFILEGEQRTFPGPKSPTGTTTIAAYRRLFRGVRQETAVGEASPCYLFSRQAPRRIKQYIPDAKLIAILRNPVERAYSHFAFHRLHGEEPLADFEAALAAEQERERMGWFCFWAYRGMGCYGRQIERYASLFARRQMRFFLFEDLLSDPAALCADIFRFLGVSDTVRIRSGGRHNPSGMPRNRGMHAFLTRPNIIKQALKRVLSEKTQYNLLTMLMNRNLRKPPLDREVRRRVLVMFREDILRTQDLIGRDLSHWLTPAERQNRY
jgi:hypothetical protein